VDIIRALREQYKNGDIPTIRAGIMIGKVMRLSGSRANSSDQGFVQSCLDILDSEVGFINEAKRTDTKEKIVDLIKKVC
ncbi:MAG: hypothetical protein KKG62_01230, partial [Actinobacteria bacterium]|nr:hypothetical protein [Actinomycetota bacterium]